MAPPIDLLALQRTVGNRRVARLLETSAIALVQRGFEDWGYRPSPPDPALKKLDQNRVLRRIQAWFDAHMRKLKWLGLNDSDKAEDRALALDVSSLMTHLSVLLALDEEVPRDELDAVGDVWDRAVDWLNQHETLRFAAIDATLARVRDLELVAAEKAIVDAKRSLETSVASPTALPRAVNATMRKLNRWASTWGTILDNLEAQLDAFENARLDVEEMLDSIDEMTTKYMQMKGRQGLIREKESLRQRLPALSARGVTLRRGILNEKLVLDAKKVATDATKLQQDVFNLGGRVEEAADRVSSSSGSGGGRHGTGLPTITRTNAARFPVAEMLPAAAREAQKSPEWLQAAVDFVLGRLALGRVDHIHICGGGNTLIYRDRLVRGYMTKHLDSRQSSQAEFKKILGHSTNKPVTVAVSGGVLHEVVPG